MLSHISWSHRRRCSRRKPTFPPNAKVAPYWSPNATFFPLRTTISGRFTTRVQSGWYRFFTCPFTVFFMMCGWASFHFVFVRLPHSLVLPRRSRYWMYIDSFIMWLKSSTALIWLSLRSQYKSFGRTIWAVVERLHLRRIRHWTFGIWDTSEQRPSLFTLLRVKFSSRRKVIFRLLKFCCRYRW